MIAPHAVLQIRLALTFDSSFICIRNKQFNAAAARCSQWFYRHDILGKIILRAKTLMLVRESMGDGSFNTNVEILATVIGANCRLLFDTLMSEDFSNVHIVVERSMDLDSVAMRVKTRHWQYYSME